MRSEISQWTRRSPLRRAASGCHARVLAAFYPGQEECRMDAGMAGRRPLYGGSWSWLWPPPRWPAGRICTISRSSFPCARPLSSTTAARRDRWPMARWPAASLTTTRLSTPAKAPTASRSTRSRSRSPRKSSSAGRSASTSTALRATAGWVTAMA